MKILLNNNDLNEALYTVSNLGFVPTMGSLHKGHISLIKKSLKRCKKTIVSIFVNPTQFNKKKDYKKYPRNIKKDLSTLRKLNVDYLFLPKNDHIYNYSKKSKFYLNKKEKILCAKYRKGHFEGVIEVMDRLTSMIKPKKIFMGEKDYQQLYLIKKFLSKKFKARINSCPTIRVNKSIALSTRNKLLKINSLKKASEIALFLKKIKYKSKLHDPKLVFNLNDYKKKLENKYNIKIDYLEFRDEKNLKLNSFKNNYRLFVAYNIDNVRLIDNY